MINMNVKHHNPKRFSVEGPELDYNTFASELADAEYALGLLEGSQKKLHNSELLISPLTAKEAAVSSKIEGTQSTVSDVFIHEAGGEVRYPDIAEVKNYRTAMQFAIEELKDKKMLSKHLIRSMHKILLENTRHKGLLGSFRTGDVWIAKRIGDPIEKATYVPPEAHFVDEYVDDLLEYLKNGKECTLIKAGVAHYQFEAVHPFEDGNGRIGRLLIPLVLHFNNKLSKPILYMSGYMEANRDEYIEMLHSADKSGEMELWLKFFLKSVAAQLRETQELVSGIYTLYDSIKLRFGTSKSPYLVSFLDFIFKFPVFTAPMILDSTKISSDLTVKRLIKTFVETGYLFEMPIRSGRAKVYRFKPLLDLLR
jgi:Fic family protein